MHAAYTSAALQLKSKTALFVTSVIPLSFFVFNRALLESDLVAQAQS